MVDLHTHILCGVDDGARTVEDSLQMLRMEREQGVDTVVLTPHFYRDRQRPEHFLDARKRAAETLFGAVDALDAAEKETMPQMILGAEVAWRPNMSQWEDLDAFCIAGTRNLLLELPFVPWDAHLCNALYDLMNRTGVTPILAHLERYIPLQDKGQVREILSLGLPAQITAQQFLHHRTRGNALKALKNWAYVVATDCHDCKDRKPAMADAMAVVQKRLGRHTVEALDETARSLLR